LGQIDPQELTSRLCPEEEVHDKLGEQLEEDILEHVASFVSTILERVKTLRKQGIADDFNHPDTQQLAETYEREYKKMMGFLGAAFAKAGFKDNSLRGIPLRAAEKVCEYRDRVLDAPGASI
jgi:hypothetical protein